MKPRAMLGVASIVLVVHVLAALAIFSQDAVDFFPKRRALEIAEREAALRPPPPEPNFSASDRTEIDPRTGAQVRLREFTVSTELYRGPGGRD